MAFMFAHAKKDLLAFFADRLKVQVREQGVRHDLVNAVFALGTEDDLVRLLARVKALQAFIVSEDGKNLLVAYNRAANIVKAEERKDKALASEIRSAPNVMLFEQAEEKAVWMALGKARASAGPALEREDFTAAMSALASLRGPLDAFFEKVTVNVSDRPDLRLNRLRLLRQISGTIDHVADFSKIEG
jgi:glycyl-tRNA synthetase beta chain